MDLTTIKREKAKRELTPESSTALLNSLPNGKTIVGNYNSVNSYNRGQLAIFTENGKTVIKEALVDIPANTAYNSTQWDSVTLGSSYLTCGDLTLTCTDQYPFNNSETLVTLAKEAKDTNYHVLFAYDNTQVDSVEVYGKLINAFKVKYTGPATSVNIRYYVIQ